MIRQRCANDDDEKEASWRDYSSIREGVLATCGRLVQQWVITRVTPGVSMRKRRTAAIVKYFFQDIFCWWATPAYLLNYLFVQQC